ncbi:hypothetical protein DFJ73DRAFT_842094 [Zopfochytrium polystomum]|nr:hypothetical protein DFJ73DRAFT_842094 [Zopfochytrium polystomum]
MPLPHSIVVDFIRQSLQSGAHSTPATPAEALWNSLKVKSSTKNTASADDDDEGDDDDRVDPHAASGDNPLQSTAADSRPGGESLAIVNYTSGSPRGDPVAMHCRGLVLDLQALAAAATDPTGGEDPAVIVAACMPRFFNFGESVRATGAAAVGDRPPPDSPCLAVEKLDGTYVQVFRWSGRCELSTRSVIGGGKFRAPFLAALRRRADGDDDSDEGFFQKVFSAAFDAFDVHTLWFEYTSPNNQIVTLYDDSRVTLLGGFYQNGKELSRDDVRELSASSALAGAAVGVPIMFPTTIGDLLKSYETENRASAGNGKVNDSNVEEGFVVYVDDRRFKVKNPKWVVLHLARFNVPRSRTDPAKILELLCSRPDDIRELMATVPVEAGLYEPYFNVIDVVNERIRRLWEQFRGHPKKYQASAAVDEAAPALFNWFRYDNAPINFQTDPGKSGKFMKARMAAIQIMNILPPPPVTKREVVPKSYTVFGCADSTDVDVCVFAKTAEEFFADYDMEEITGRPEYAGKTVDVNVVRISKDVDGVWRVKESRKGPAPLTHNMVFLTARSPTPLSTVVPLSVDDLVRGVATHLLRSLRDLLSTAAFAAERSNRRSSFEADLRIGYTVDVLRRGIPAIDTPDWRSAMKTLVMKMLQTCLYALDKTEAYHKQQLASVAAEKLDLSEEVLLWYLFRGTRGSPDSPDGETLRLLTESFAAVVDDISGSGGSAKTLTWSPFPLDTAVNPTRLDEALFRAFLASPAACTPEFAEGFHRIHGADPAAITRLFLDAETAGASVAESTDEPAATKAADAATDAATTTASKPPPHPAAPPAPPPLPAHIAAVARADAFDGTPAWRALQDRYNGDNGFASLPRASRLGVAGRFYNLLRGRVAEAVAVASISPQSLPGLRRVALGMLVAGEEDDLAAAAVTPDCVLISDDGMRAVLYEVKCIVANAARAARRETPAYRRALDIAGKQLDKGREILRRAGVKAVECRLILVRAFESQLEAEVADWP